MATKWTLVPTVLPFEGLDTVTPAKADVAARKTTTKAVGIRACLFIFTFLSGWDFWSGTGKAIQLKGIRRSGRGTLDRTQPLITPGSRSEDVSGIVERRFQSIQASTECQRESAVLHISFESLGLSPNSGLGHGSWHPGNAKNGICN